MNLGPMFQILQLFSKWKTAENTTACLQHANDDRGKFSQKENMRMDRHDTEIFLLETRTEHSCIC